MLVSESLGLKGVNLLLLELSNAVLVLDVGLLLLEVLQLTCALSLFFLFLLLSHLQLFVSNLPEVSEFCLFTLDRVLLCLLSVDLKLATPLNGCLHLGFALLLLLKQSVSTVLSFGHLTVQNFLLVVLQSTELFDLTINHALPSLLLV